MCLHRQFMVREPPGFSSRGTLSPTPRLQASEGPCSQVPQHSEMGVHTQCDSTSFVEKVLL